MTSITGSTYLDTLTSAKSAAATGTTASKSGSLDQTAFLKLMTTQLQTQDPFNPVDNSQMVAQMAQFSATTGIAEMNASLKSMAADIAGSRVGDAASWIGRSALVSSKVAVPLSDGSYAGRITLPDDASAVSLSLVDAKGSIVYAQDIGQQTAGDVNFSWNGKGADGSVAASGPLKVVVAASGSKGTVTPAIATWTDVAGVQSPSGGTAAKLVTGLGAIAQSAALSLA